MLLTYTPEGGERQEFAFHPDKLMSPEAEALEDAGGASWDNYEEFGRKLMAGNLRASRALLWVMLRRTNPGLRFSDLVVRVDEVSLDYDAAERALIRDRIASDPNLSEERRAAALATLGDEDGEPEPAIGAPGKGEPDGSGTGSP